VPATPAASGAPQVVYTSSPYVMPGAASISAMPMTSYTTMPAMPMAYSTWNARSVRICWKTFKLPKGALMFAGL